MNLPKIGISQGDPNGIGLEIILKTFQNEMIYNYCIPILYANPKSFSFHKKIINIEKPGYNLIKDVKEAKEGQLNLLVGTPNSTEITIGKPTEAAGNEAYLCFKRAAQELKDKKIDALVTAPLDKSTVVSQQIFTGHTSYLNELFNAKGLMILFDEGLRVGLVTEHLALKDVSQHLTKELLENKILIAIESLKNDFGISKPKIAVLGLNPHNGENGKIGKEDSEIIKPVIDKLYGQGIYCFGPYSADGYFGTKNYLNFDLTLSIYHDQGLVPFKLLSFDAGVNYTAGLECVRTSPDHGVGYNIAGKNIASITSFSNALFSAIEIYNQRNENSELNKNPLKMSEFKRERFRLEQG